MLGAQLPPALWVVQSGTARLGASDWLPRDELSPVFTQFISYTARRGHSPPPQQQCFYSTVHVTVDYKILNDTVVYMYLCCTLCPPDDFARSSAALCLFCWARFVSNILIIVHCAAAPSCSRAASTSGSAEAEPAYSSLWKERANIIKENPISCRFMLNPGSLSAMVVWITGLELPVSTLC